MAIGIKYTGKKKQIVKGNNLYADQYQLTDEISHFFQTNRKN